MTTTQIPTGAAISQNQPAWYPLDTVREALRIVKDERQKTNAPALVRRSGYKEIKWAGKGYVATYQVVFAGHILADISDDERFVVRVYHAKVTVVEPSAEKLAALIMRAIRQCPQRLRELVPGSDYRARALPLSDEGRPLTRPPAPVRSLWMDVTRVRPA